MFKVQDAQGPRCSRSKMLKIQGPRRDPKLQAICNLITNAVVSVMVRTSGRCSLLRPRLLWSAVPLKNGRPKNEEPYCPSKPCLSSVVYNECVKPEQVRLVGHGDGFLAVRRVSVLQFLLWETLCVRHRRSYCGFSLSGVNGSVIQASKRCSW